MRRLKEKILYNEIYLHFFIYKGLLLWTLLIFSFLHLNAQEIIVSGELPIKGIELTVDPVEQVVPINTPTIIKTIWNGENFPYQSDLVVKAELSGPGITQSITLSTPVNQPFAIPPFAIKGT